MAQGPRLGPAAKPYLQLREWAGAAVPILATTVFLSLWWRSYLGVSNDGWHFFGAWRILHGEMPYRDYYLFIPPFHQLKIAGVILLFGERLIAAQAVGFAERVVLAGALYFWLRRQFGRAETALGVTFGLFVYYAASSETLSSMLHEASIWAVFAGACASAALESRDKRALWWALAGVFCGVAFMTKQTSGAGIVFALFTFAGWKAMRDAPGERRGLLAMGAGALVPVAVIAVWLAANGAFAAFVDQAFVRGPASKGSPAQILLRPLVMLVENAWQVRFTVVGLAAAGALVWVASSRALSAKPVRLPWAAAGVAAALAAGVVIGWRGGVPMHLFFELAPSAVALRITLFFALAMSGVLVLRWFRTPSPTTQDDQPLLLAWASLCIAAFSALSWFPIATMALPGLPFAAASALSAVPGGFLGRIWRPAVTAALLAAVFNVVQSKLARPFAWGGWTEPGVAAATETSDLALLRGLRLSPETKHAVEAVTRAVQAGSRPGEPIFVYPHIPVFYLLAERPAATFGPVHFIDVSPDWLAREDGERLLADPPKSIVYLKLTEAQMQESERAFRDGRRSGQRDLVDTLDRLTSERYELVADIQTPLTGRSLQVWSLRAPD
jgi:hypothetical protein